ncbi:Rhs-family protein [Kosakonia cowanii]
MMANNGKGVRTKENEKKVADALDKDDKKFKEISKRDGFSCSGKNGLLKKKLQVIGYEIFG